MHLFQILPEDFFKPLTSKYKRVYTDCLGIIYDAYKSEYSFGVDREIVTGKLQEYFEEHEHEYEFENANENENENENININGAYEKVDSNTVPVGSSMKDPREKANTVLRVLRNCGWIEFETASDYIVKVNLSDYSATIIESFNKIVRNEEMEYQSVISQIHGALLNEEGYRKPYEFIIKGVIENTENLISGLKKLNTMIKKRIDQITKDKSAAQIVEDFFVYHRDIGSKAYHRIKTSDNISRFRIAIVGKLQDILNDRMIYAKAVDGYMEIEQREDRDEAEEELRMRILEIISSFHNYDEIIREIDSKHTKYISSAVARAKFLLNNSTNAEGKISRILTFLAEELNSDESSDLSDGSDPQIMKIFEIFPQQFIDGDSLYVMPITRKFELPAVLDAGFGISEEERELRRSIFAKRNRERFSLRNINAFVAEQLGDDMDIKASSLPLKDKHDMIRIIFINLYGRYDRSEYKIRGLNEEVKVNGFRFTDFVVEKGM